MEAKEWRTIDKTDWQRGEWDNEPDKAQWADEATGLPCLVVRTPRSGHLCGYVGVAEGHPWFNQGYDSVTPSGKPRNEDVYDPEQYVRVHGGLTFAGFCQEHADEGSGICHVPAPGEPERIWWLGFDCAHCDDRTGMAYPKAARDSIDSINRQYGIADRDVYRSFAYVKDECTRLAAQAAKAAQP